VRGKSGRSLVRQTFGAASITTRRIAPTERTLAPLTPAPAFPFASASGMFSKPQLGQRARCSGNARSQTGHCWSAKERPQLGNWTCFGARNFILTAATRKLGLTAFLRRVDQVDESRPDRAPVSISLLPIPAWR
jgi:hypothetical protein